MKTIMIRMMKMNLENSAILVVDDDHDIVNAIAKLLGKEGYIIYKAYNGLEAIDADAA